VTQTSPWRRPEVRLAIGVCKADQPHENASDDPRGTGEQIIFRALVVDEAECPYGCDEDDVGDEQEPNDEERIRRTASHNSQYAASAKDGPGRLRQLSKLSHTEARDQGIWFTTSRWSPVEGLSGSARDRPGPRTATSLTGEPGHQG
jgi:hypothetical protein